MVLLAVGRRTGVEVTGDSMLPTLAAGDRVLIDAHAAVRPGESFSHNIPTNKAPA